VRSKIEFRNEQGEKFVFSIDEAKEIYRMLHDLFGGDEKQFISNETARNPDASDKTLYNSSDEETPDWGATRARCP